MVNIITWFSHVFIEMSLTDNIETCSPLLTLCVSGCVFQQGKKKRRKREKQQDSSAGNDLSLSSLPNSWTNPKLQYDILPFNSYSIV